MNPDQLRAITKWLEGLAEYDALDPVKNEEDLREWARHVARCEEHRITSVDYQAVCDLVNELAPPEEKAREARRQKTRSKQDIALAEGDMAGFLASLEEQEAKLEAFQKSGAAGRREKGKPTRMAIVKMYRGSDLPERDRAARIGKELDKSPQYVRRVLKRAGIK